MTAQRVTLKILAVFFGVWSAVAPAAAAEEAWKPADHFWPEDVGDGELLLPKNLYNSKYGHGQYRLDGIKSRGHLNCIFLTFMSEAKATGTANLTEWAPSTALIQERKALVRTALYPNPFLEKPPAAAAMLEVRITAQDAETADELQRLAEAFLRKNARVPLKF
ncbi:MAG: hypothetical protein AAGK14_02970 [Verrucomicrobiota bacterium]